METHPQNKINLPAALIGVAGTMEDVNPGDLVPITDIPDFVEPCHLPFPVALRAAGSKECHVLDNWPLAAAAIDIDARIITCLVYRIDSVDDVALMLGKLAIRIRPTVGIVRYSEILRNILLLLSKMSGKNIVAFGRGGDRKSDTFQGQSDVLTLLSAWTGKAPKTISGYLTHAAHLNTIALNALVRESTCSRSFFESVQHRKQNLIRTLKESGAAEEEITETISLKVMEWWIQYKTHVEIETAEAELTSSPGPYPAEEAPERKVGTHSTDKGFEFTSGVPIGCQANLHRDPMHESPCGVGGFEGTDPASLIPEHAHAQLQQILTACLASLEVSVDPAEMTTLIDELICNLTSLRNGLAGGRQRNCEANPIVSDCCRTEDEQEGNNGEKEGLVRECSLNRK